MAFLVEDTDALQEEVLGKYFKHNNFSSFIRQLNMYGFRKLGDPNHWEFAHEFFRENDEESLARIERKSVKKTQAELAAKGISTNPVLQKTSRNSRRSRAIRPSWTSTIGH